LNQIGIGIGMAKIDIFRQKGQDDEPISPLGNIPEPFGKPGKRDPISPASTCFPGTLFGVFNEAWKIPRINKLGKKKFC